MQPTILGRMERKSFTDMHCSVAQCLEVVGAPGEHYLQVSEGLGRLAGVNKQRREVRTDGVVARVDFNNGFERCQDARVGGHRPNLRSPTGGP